MDIFGIVGYVELVLVVVQECSSDYSINAAMTFVHVMTKKSNFYVNWLLNYEAFKRWWSKVVLSGWCSPMLSTSFIVLS